MPETDAVRRSSLRRDKLLSKMDLHLCEAASKLVSLREDLESLKSEADLKLRPSAKRGEKPFDKTNPYHLRRAFGDLDPAKLVRCYKRPLRHVRFEDEIEHPLKTNDDGVWFVKTAEVPPKILIRDDAGRLIVSNSEVLNGVTEGIIAGRDWREVVRLFDCDGGGPGHCELGELLFNRNWPLTEKRGEYSIYQSIRN